MVFAELDGEQQVKMVQLNILALVDLTHQFYQECGSAFQHH